MFKTLLRKELLEQLRAHKILITVAVFFVTGLISPLLAKYTPVLLSSVPDLPAGFENLIPEPTVQDSIGQYVKNMSQIGVLLVILLNMGSVAQEKERGTAAMLMSKPVKAGNIIIAKWLAAVASLLLGILVAAFGCYIYTTLLFESIPYGDFLVLNGLIALFLIVYLTLAILASTLARSQLVAAALAFAALAILLILGALPRIGIYLPGALLDWGGSVLLNTGSNAWGALIVALGIITLALVAANLYLHQEEL